MMAHPPLPNPNLIELDGPTAGVEKLGTWQERAKLDTIRMEKPDMLIVEASVRYKKTDMTYPSQL